MTIGYGLSPALAGLQLLTFISSPRSRTGLHSVAICDGCSFCFNRSRTYLNIRSLSMKLTKPALLLSACLLLGACGKDTNTNNTKSNVSSTTTTTTTANNPATATPTPKPTPQATTSPNNTKLSDDTNTKPEDAAKGLFNVWDKNDREAAKRFASDEVITKLFQRKNDLKGVSFQGCKYYLGEISRGGYLCSYIHEDGRLEMNIKDTESDSYKVTSIDFVPPRISINVHG